MVSNPLRSNVGSASGAALYTRPPLVRVIQSGARWQGSPEQLAANLSDFSSLQVFACTEKWLAFPPQMSRQMRALLSLPSFKRKLT